MPKPLTKSEIKVLRVLNERYGSDMNCLYSSFIASLSDLTVLQARRAIKSLQRRGHAELVRGIFNDEGQVVGSGYCCTPSGHSIALASQEDQ